MENKFEKIDEKITGLFVDNAMNLILEKKNNV